MWTGDVTSVMWTGDVTIVMWTGDVTIIMQTEWNTAWCMPMFGLILSKMNSNSNAILIFDLTVKLI